MNPGTFSKKEQRIMVADYARLHSEEEENAYWRNLADRVEIQQGHTLVNTWQDSGGLWHWSCTCDSDSAVGYKDPRGLSVDHLIHAGVVE